MSTALDKKEEFRAEFQRRMAEEGGLLRIEGFNETSLAWLALAPAWTGTLAEACEFPTGGSTFPGFLKRVQSAGFGASSSSAPIGGLESWHKARVLVALAPYSHESSPDTFVESILKLEDRHLRVDALIDLLKVLPADRKQVLAEQVLAEIDKIRNPCSRAEALTQFLTESTALSALAPDSAAQVRAQVLADILEALQENGDSNDRARLLTILVPYLTYEEFSDALSKLKLVNPVESLKVYLALLESPKMNVTARDIETALAQAQDLTEGYPKALALSAILQAVRRRGGGLEEEVARRIERDSLSMLSRLLDGEKTVNRRLAVEVLKQLGRYNVNSVIALLNESNRELRLAAIRALGKIGDKSAAEPLLQNLGDVQVRAAVIEALGRIGVTSAVPSLFEALSDENESVRLKAIDALGNMSEVQARSMAVEKLSKSLTDESPSVRGAAARALGRIGNIQAVDWLLKALDDEISVRTAALQALSALALRDIQVSKQLKRVSLKLIGACSSLEDELEEARVVTSLYHFFDKNDAESMFMLLSAFQLEEARAEVLIGLAPQIKRFSKKWVERLLVVAQAISDVDSRADVFIALIPHLSDEMRQKVQSIAKEIGNELHFWMPNAVRAHVLAELRQECGASFLHREAATIGSKILLAQKRGIPVSTEVQRWGEVAARAKEGLSTISLWLGEKIQRLIQMGDVSEARAWVSTGEMLSQALKGELESVVLLGRRQVEIEYRRIQDERHLKYFLEHEEQVADFLKVVHEKDENGPWALHYVGMGGVGKTMLLRHINARLATQHNLIVSRIDFDYINPDYPVRKPGQLLIELAQELRSYDLQVGPNSLFDILHQRVISLHEALSDDQMPDGPLANIHHHAFEAVLKVFTDLLESLPRPVVLIMDTAEELSRLRPTGGMLPNIEATFDILERVQKRVPSVTVIFAGRRLLTISGRGWQIAERSLQRGGQNLPKRKDYLLVHEIRGFNEENAKTYFTKIRNLTITPEMLSAILMRSMDVGRAVELVGASSTAADDGPYYNPFDLALYADWLSEDPNLPVETISSGQTNPYIELRIIGRITQPSVSQLIPAAVLLRRFNQEMLQPMLNISDAAFEEAYRYLSEYEWINFQQDPVTRATFLEIDRNLYTRLLEYYEHPSRSNVLEEVRDKLAPHLDQLVRQRPLGDLSVDQIDAALRLLPAASGMALWNSIEARIPHQADWNWVKTVTARLLGERGAAGTKDKLLWFAVRAAQIAAHVHEAPAADTSADWQEILEGLQNFSASGAAAEVSFIRSRALMGLMAASRFSQTQPQIKYREELRKILERVVSGEGKPAQRWVPGMDESMAAEQFAAALCAALDAMLDRAEMKGDQISALELRSIYNWSREIEQSSILKDLIAFAMSLGLRALLLAPQRGKDLNEVMIIQFAVRRHLRSIERREAEQRYWTDWKAPSSLRDRLRLEILLGNLKIRDGDIETLLVTSEFENYLDDALKSLECIESERLVSFILKLRLSVSLVPAAELQVISGAEVESYDPNRQPIIGAHKSIPPLFATLARCWLAIGEPTRALQFVDDRQDQAARKVDKPSQQMANSIKIEIVRRMRLHEQAQSLRTRAVHLGNRQIMYEALQMAAVVEPASSRSDSVLGSKNSAEELHTWWSCQSTLTTKDFQNTIKTLRKRSPHLLMGGKKFKAQFPHAMLILDLLEAELLLLENPNWGKRESTASRRRKFQLACERLRNQLTPIFEKLEKSYDHAEEVLRLSLRHQFLTSWIEDNAPGRFEKPGLERLVGTRRMAEIALEEGELLALRFPRRAIGLLRLAHRKFREAKDTTGSAIREDFVGGFITAVLSTIAALNASEIDIARDRYQEAAEAYKSLGLSGHRSPLMTWTELENLLHPKSDGLLSLHDNETARYVMTDVAWSGWMQRLMRCMVWRHDRLGKEKFTDDFVARLQSIYGVQLPIELDLVSRRDPLRAQELARKKVTLNTRLGLSMIALGSAIAVAMLWALITGQVTRSSWLAYTLLSVALIIALVNYEALFEWVWIYPMKNQVPKSDRDYFTLPQSPKFVDHGLTGLIVFGFLWLTLSLIIGGYWLYGWVARFFIPEGMSTIRKIISYVGIIFFIYLAGSGTLGKVTTWGLNVISRFIKSISLATLSSTIKVLLYLTLALIPLAVYYLIKANQDMAYFQLPAAIRLLEVMRVVGVAAAGIGANYLYRLLSEKTRSYLASRTTASLLIVAPHDATQATLAQSDAMRTALIQFFRQGYSWNIPGIRAAKPVRLHARVSTPGNRAYAASAGDVPAAIRGELIELKHALRGRKLPVSLQVEPELAFLPWEAFFSMSPLLGNDEKEFSEPFQFWRPDQPLSPSFSPVQPKKKELSIDVVGSSTWSLMIEEGWQPMSRRVSFKSLRPLKEERWTSSTAQGLTEIAERVCILHLIGMPIRTSGGYFLSVESKELANIESRLLKISKHREEDVLIRPDKLPLKTASLVIIQCAPSEPRARTDSDREQMNYLRAFAAEVFAAGAEAVLVLPPLSSNLAISVLARLSTKLNKNPTPDYRQLLNIVSEIRHLIAHWQPPLWPDRKSTKKASVLFSFVNKRAKVLAEPQRELAFDVCLFARSKNHSKIY